MSCLANAGETNFLGRLVDKSLGRADVVQPRLPSLFEPIAPGDAAVGLVAHDERAEPTEESREAPPARPRGKAPRTQATWETESGEEQASAPSTAEADRSPPAVVPDPTSLSRPLEHASVSDQAAQNAFAAERTRPLQSFSTEQERPVATIAEEVVVPSPRPLTISESAGEPAIPKRIDGAMFSEPRAHHGDRQEGVQPIATAKPWSRDAVTHAGTLLPKMRPEVYESWSVPPQPPHESQASGEQQQTSGSAPVINVTIGRVEVRAVQQPLGGRPPMASRSAQPMSLVDYLHRREGQQ